MCPHRLAVRTPPFHGGNRGSSPRGDAILRAHFKEQVFKNLFFKLREHSLIKFEDALFLCSFLSCIYKSKSLSSSGLGHRPFTAVTGVRVSVGTPLFSVIFLVVHYFRLFIGRPTLFSFFCSIPLCHPPSFSMIYVSFFVFFKHKSSKKRGGDFRYRVKKRFFYCLV